MITLVIYLLSLWKKLYRVRWGGISEVEVDKFNAISYWVNGRVSRRFTSHESLYEKPSQAAEHIMQTIRKRIESNEKTLALLPVEIEKDKKELQQLEKIVNETRTQTTA